MSRIAWVVVVLALLLTLVKAVMRPHEEAGGAPEPSAVEAITGGVVPIFLFELPPGLADQLLPIPDDNPMSAEKILLGEWLFFDVRLSETQQMSCETCHVPEQGWADGRARSPKHDGRLNVRHTPSLYGAGFFPELYWDGRAQGLEAQVRAVWEGQMGARPARIAAELGQMSGYRGAFQEAFGGPPTADRIVDALATFVRTIHAGDTSWDRHPTDEAALDETEVGRGVQGVLGGCAVHAVSSSPGVHRHLVPQRRDWHGGGDAGCRPGGVSLRNGGPNGHSGAGRRVRGVRRVQDAFLARRGAAPAVLSRRANGNTRSGGRSDVGGRGAQSCVGREDRRAAAHAEPAGIAPGLSRSALAGGVYLPASGPAAIGSPSRGASRLGSPNAIRQ